MDIDLFLSYHNVLTDTLLLDVDTALPELRPEIDESHPTRDSLDLHLALFRRQGYFCRVTVGEIPRYRLTCWPREQVAFVLDAVL